MFIPWDASDMVLIFVMLAAAVSDCLLGGALSFASSWLMIKSQQEEEQIWPSGLSSVLLFQQRSSHICQVSSLFRHQGHHQIRVVLLVIGGVIGWAILSQSCPVFNLKLLRLSGGR